WPLGVFAMTKCRGDNVGKKAQIKGFDDVIESSETNALLGDLTVNESSDHNDRDVRVLLPNLCKHRHTAASRQTDIKKNQSDVRGFFDHLQRDLSVAGLQNLIAAFFEDLVQNVADFFTR